MSTPEPGRQPQAAVAATIPVPARPRARRKRLSAFSGIARQFGGPSGPIGHLVTGLLVRGNASFNRWLVHELGTVVSHPANVIELGCGPGIALRELLAAYPAALVVGIDPSPVVLKNARRRNTVAVAGGRLTLVTGDVTRAAEHGPADLVMACHVLYFWADPVRELRRAREVLASGGHVALGYQLRQHMPPIAQRTFPREGFTLYDSDDQVATLLQHAGFTAPWIRVFGDPAHPGGRLALATPRPAGLNDASELMEAAMMFPAGGGLRRTAARRAGGPVRPGPRATGWARAMWAPGKPVHWPAPGVPVSKQPTIWAAQSGTARASAWTSSFDGERVPADQRLHLPRPGIGRTVRYR